MLYQNATAILLQNVTEVYYKTRQFFITKYCSFITNSNNFIQNATVIRKCDFYYKLQQHSLS